MAERTCPKCSGQMEDGFTLDHTHGENRQAAWVEGSPQRSFWMGLKAPRAGQHAITTYRCSKCGYLESYAA
jgi:ribosomal protein S27AE